VENEKKKRKSFTSKDKDSLLEKKEQFLSSLENQKLEIPLIADEVQTLFHEKSISEVIKEYMEVYVHTVAYSTYQQTHYFSRLVDEQIGSMKINDFSFMVFQKLMNDLAYMDNQMPRAEKSLKGIRTFVTALLKFAKRQHLISAEDFDIATEGIKIPKSAAIYDKNSRFMDYDSLGFMLNTLKYNPRYYLMVRILALTGMRGQELLALEKRTWFVPRITSMYAKPWWNSMQKL